MTSIETTEEIMDKLRLNIAQSGISAVRKLYILFEKQDQNGTGQTANEEFASALMKNGIHLSKNDLSQICRFYKVNDLEINYAKFMEEVSPPLYVYFICYFLH